MNVLLIDNYDSFTYNIVELLRQLNFKEITICKNDEISSNEASHYDRIILSPGPATPMESGHLMEIIRDLSPTHSLLGICLGHQAIAQSFGASLKNEPVPYHGFKSELQQIAEHKIFQGLPLPSSHLTSNISPFAIGLYHSWTVDEINFPSSLEITSKSKEGNIMSIRHRTYDIHGLQFHPESYMTDYGKEMVRNFLEG